MKATEKYELLPLSGSSLKKLAKDCYTLIDVRPKNEFINNHIDTAINIHCSPLLIRRFQRGGKAVENLFIPDEVRRKLQKDSYKIIILYDNNSCEGKIAKELNQTASVFQNGKRAKSLFFLDGKYKHV